MSTITDNTRALTAIFYINGINTDEDSVKGHIDALHRITGLFFRAHYNDAASPEGLGKIKLAGAATGLSVVGSLLSVAAPPLVLVFLPLYALSASLMINEVDEIQEKKVDVAKDLANRIERFLNANRERYVTVIGHSQGAHVVNLALDQLPKCLRDRISVIGIGGLVSICPSKAARVANIVNQSDTVAKSWAGTYVKNILKHRAPDLLCRCNTRRRRPTPKTQHLKHDAADYLKNSEYIARIREFTNISPQQLAKERMDKQQRQASRQAQTSAGPRQPIGNNGQRATSLPGTQNNARTIALANAAARNHRGPVQSIAGRQMNTQPSTAVQQRPTSSVGHQAKPLQGTQNNVRTIASANAAARNHRVPMQGIARRQMNTQPSSAVQQRPTSCIAHQATSLPGTQNNARTIALANAAARNHRGPVQSIAGRQMNTQPSSAVQQRPTSSVGHQAKPLQGTQNNVRTITSANAAARNHRVPMQGIARRQMNTQPSSADQQRPTSCIAHQATPLQGTQINVRTITSANAPQGTDAKHC